MQSLGPFYSTGGTLYTAAQITALLTAPNGRDGFIFEQINSNYECVADISKYVRRGGHLQHDSGRAVARSLSISVRQDCNLDWLNDLVRVRYQIAAPDGSNIEWILGLFTPITPKRNVTTSGVWRDLTMGDLSQVLNVTKFSDSYTIHAGASYIDAVKTIVALALPNVGFIVEPSTATIPAALSFDAGSTLLEATNQLLAAITYTPLWIDENTFARIESVPDYTQVVPAYTFDATQDSANIVGSEIGEEPDLTRGINTVIVQGEDARRAVVTGTYINSSALSPISTVSLGRTTLQVIKDSKIPDSATAALRAQREVQAFAREFAPISLETSAWPVGQNRDVYGLTYTDPDDGIVSKTVVESSWTMALQTGARTQHELNEVVVV